MIKVVISLSRCCLPQSLCLQTGEPVFDVSFHYVAFRMITGFQRNILPENTFDDGRNDDVGVDYIDILTVPFFSFPSSFRHPHIVHIARQPDSLLALKTSQHIMPVHPACRYALHVACCSRGLHVQVLCLLISHDKSTMPIFQRAHSFSRGKTVHKRGSGLNVESICGSYVRLCISKSIDYIDILSDTTSPTSHRPIGNVGIMPHGPFSPACLFAPHAPIIHKAHIAHLLLQ